MSNRNIPEFSHVPRENVNVQIGVVRKHSAESKHEFKGNHLTFQGFWRLFGFVFACLLLSCVWSAVTGNNNSHTFESFLSFLDNVPTLSLDFLKWTSIDLGDWGVFDFMALFLERCLTVVNAFFFIAQALINVIIFVIWFLGWLLFV